MTQHTKGDHLKPEMRDAVTGSGEPCFCDRVQTINMNAVGATGQGQQWMTGSDTFKFTITTASPANNVTVPSQTGMYIGDIWYPQYPYTVPYVWPSTPVEIHYHQCEHEKRIEILEVKIRELEKRAILDDEAKLMKEALEKWKQVNDLLEKKK